jgi:SAM-dependent methyltransferase
MSLFAALGRIVDRPEPFAYYTSPQLWNDPHISKGMLEAHLNPNHDVASYRGEFIDTAVAWIASRFGVSEKTRICDFGCGPGLWTTRLAERGAIVTGIDLSKRSIRYAQDTAKNQDLSIRYILQDYLQFSSNDRFDLILMISQDFSVLSPSQRKALLQVFRSHLSEGGALLLDVASLLQFSQAKEKTKYEFCSEGGFWSPGPHHVFTSSFKYEAEHLLCSKYVVVERSREFEICVWSQCYGVESLNEVFEENGLQILQCLSDVSGTPLEEESPTIAIVAGRPT